MTTTTPAAIANALDAAVRAPSPMNTQPWAFDVDGDRIALWLDRSRVLPVADPQAREARLSCGAALCNLRIALRAHGRVALVTLLPDGNDPDLLAVTRIAGERIATATDLELARAIPLRRTNRHPFRNRDVPPAARSLLTTAARAEGARLELVDDPERYGKLAELVRRAERAQDSDGAYQVEIKRWVGGADGRRDGIPLTAVGPPAVPSRNLALRAHYRPNPLPARRFENQPLLAAILTSAAGPRYDLIAGAAMQRALLAGCTVGLSASFLSQPFEVPEVRSQLPGALGVAGEHAEIHTLLRIGYGTARDATPRRPATDVASHHAVAPRW
ncbi:Acg family FMN-binding oxidoreductase [Haloechinothrix sp. LS1_15]|uniref:Acg family FMN-binding oxidoreductase n=1 Tax=Haloechinothrix sp. LS1_15 TaxID=2652248 RepID=UPI002945760C|nr:nitroreductase family protein [Haloechinothrix sp. LS1_15]MDV6012670.1 hypothetical protein [Haloechinothrix sp. LS1_15]